MIKQFLAIGSTLSTGNKYSRSFDVRGNATACGLLYGSSSFGGHIIADRLHFARLHTEYFVSRSLCQSTVEIAAFKTEEILTRKYIINIINYKYTINIIN